MFFQIKHHPPTILTHSKHLPVIWRNVRLFIHHTWFLCDSVEVGRSCRFTFRKRMNILVSFFSYLKPLVYLVERHFAHKAMHRALQTNRECRLRGSLSLSIKTLPFPFIRMSSAVDKIGSPRMFSFFYSIPYNTETKVRAKCLRCLKVYDQPVIITKQ